MGSDVFLAFFGIKISLDPDDEEAIEACSAGTDVRCQVACSVGLQVHSGRMTDGEDDHLYIGQRLGWLGLEHDSYVVLSESHFRQISESVRAQLVRAGFMQ